MADGTRALSFVYDGWQGYQESLISAISPLTPEQLAYRAHPQMRSVAEVAWHIGDGRVNWFSRLESAPGVEPLFMRVKARNFKEPADYTAAHICAWLEETGRMVQATLRQWTVDDLECVFEQEFQGARYAVSRQWVIWRIMAHDIHHGGQISELLAAQGVFPFDLTEMGGHITMPPVID